MKIRSRFLTQLFAVVAVGLVRLLFKTCRVRTMPEDPDSNCYGSTGRSAGCLYCIWHDQIMMTVFTGRPQKMAGLVEVTQDGSYLAESMKLVGITCRGSSKRGGSRAMRELLERVAIIMSPSRLTGRGDRDTRSRRESSIWPPARDAAYFGCIAAVTPGTVLRRKWTDMMIPWPFTVLYAAAGPPRPCRT